MNQLFSPVVLGTIAGLIMAILVLLFRLRAAKKPVSAKKILLPPLMMSTGFAMFLLPGTMTPFHYDLIAFLLGMLLSVPLILSSKFEVIGDQVYLKRSKAFVGILLALVVIRLVVKAEVGDAFSPLQTAGLFFVLAFGMIVPWRLAMYVMYRQIARNRTT
ncbi:MAG: cytochrome c biogenesis protein CcdC [Brevibacillus sp.]|nr:cytochrome c biogenesis protein CcdC [Brevibacillus sp.]